MSAELAARRTAAEATLADFQAEQASAPVSRPTDSWALRLAAALSDLLAWLELEDAAGAQSPALDADEIQAAFPDFEIAHGADLLWHARLTGPDGSRAPRIAARTLAELAQMLNDLIAGEGR